MKLLIITVVNEFLILDIFDIGAYSTRPGADDVSPEEELRRLQRGKIMC